MLSEADLIGEGSYGGVYECIWERDKKSLAIKRIQFGIDAE